MTEEKRVNQRLKGIDKERFDVLAHIFATDKAALQIALLSWDHRLTEIKRSFLYKLLCDMDKKGFNVHNVFLQLRACINKLEKQEHQKKYGNI